LHHIPKDIFPVKTAIINPEQNKLGGTISSQFLNLDLLIYLDVANNNLEGTIPTQFGKFSGMTHLLLGDNNFVGSIPSELKNLPSLSVLSVENNDFNGTVSFPCFRDDLNFTFDENEVIKDCITDAPTSSPTITSPPSAVPSHAPTIMRRFSSTGNCLLSLFNIGR